MNTVVDLDSTTADWARRAQAVQPPTTVEEATSRWLARHGISEFAWSLFVKLFSNLVPVNNDGLHLCQLIQEHDQAFVSGQMHGPLRIVPSTDLGRVLARDKRLRHLVTTIVTASMSQNMTYVKDLLCYMAYDSLRPSGERNSDYHSSQSAMKAIVNKIVESVFANVVISGPGYSDFPDELRPLHHHYLDSDYLGSYIMEIARRPDTDIVISSYGFLADLVRWCLHHYQGRLIVKVASKKVYEKALGRGSGQVFFLVETACNPEICLDYHGTNVELCTFDEDDTGNSDPKDRSNNPLLEVEDHTEGEHYSFGRHKLYDTQYFQQCYIRSPTQASSSAYHEDAIRVAQDIVNWLMDLCLCKPKTYFRSAPSFSLHFRVVEHSDEVSHLGRIADAVSRRPALLDLESVPEDSTSGRTPQEPVLATGPPPKTRRHSGPASIKWFVQAFKSLADILKTIKTGNCWYSCSIDESYSLYDNNSDICLHQEKHAGCDRWGFVHLVLNLIAEAIADASGIDSAMGSYYNLSSVKRSVIRLLWQAKAHQELLWEDWFQVVACATSGCQYEEPSAHARYGSDATPPDADMLTISSLAAVQMGSIVLAPRWLDISQPVTLKNLFHIDQIIGSIQGVEPGTFGLVYCEQTSRTPRSIDKSQVLVSPNSQDDTPTELLSLVTRTSPCSYRLLTMVIAGGITRYINPADVALSLAIRKTPRCMPDCETKGADPPEVSTGRADSITEEAITTHTFRSILQQWGPQNVLMSPPSEEHVRISEKILRPPTPCSQEYYESSEKIFIPPPAQKQLRSPRGETVRIVDQESLRVPSPNARKPFQHKASPMLMSALHANVALALSVRPGKGSVVRVADRCCMQCAVASASSSNTKRRGPRSMNIISVAWEALCPQCPEPVQGMKSVESQATMPKQALWRRKRVAAKRRSLGRCDYSLASSSDEWQVSEDEDVRSPEWPMDSYDTESVVSLSDGE